MNLHTAGTIADWEKIPADEHNQWQRTAASTNGIVTPANVLDAFAFGVTLWGLYDIKQGRRAKGLIKTLIGRTSDVVDGAIADRTGTKGPVGEMIDAGRDKIEMLAALAVAATNDDIPRDVLQIVAVRDGTQAAATGLAKLRGISMHPTKEGKLGTGLEWLSFALFEASAESSEKGKATVAKILELSAYASTALFLRYGSISAIDYLKQAMGPVPAEEI